MEENNELSPNYIPEDLRVAYDVIELPSQGILYPNKKSSVKVEYLTALDETILTSPNIVANNKVVETLIQRKVKELGFDPLDMLDGDRTAILIFLRVTGFGPEYTQLVWVDEIGEFVEGVIDLSQIKSKKLEITPDNDGLFDYKLPQSEKIVKFRFLTARDEKQIDEQDEIYMKRHNTEVSNKIFFTLERQVMSIDGVTDKMKISNILKNLSILDSRKLRNYIKDIEPGVDFNVTARIPGGGSVNTFLRFNKSFFWPDI